MAKYDDLTPKQREVIKPLDEEATVNRKLRDRLQKRLAFEQAIGFEENKVIRERIEELDKQYAELSLKIAEVYHAKKEMMKHMSLAIKEINEVERLKKLWGFE